MAEFEKAVATGAIVVVDTIAHLRPGQVGGGGTNAGPEHAGAVVIAASHAGLWTGYCAAKIAVRGVIQNDAGVGLERAGIASLPYLDKLGIPAASAAHDSCCIGDKNDMALNGVISYVNDVAAALGCARGQSVQACALLMCKATTRRIEIPPYSESRIQRWVIPDKLPLLIVDSLSLLHPDDRGSIVVAASHGGLFNGRIDGFVPEGIVAITIIDAGVGKNRAGIGRLPTLDAIGTIGVAVDANSARMGNGLSVWETGRISFVNELAKAAGIEPGFNVPDYVDASAKYWLASRAGKSVA